MAGPVLPVGYLGLVATRANGVLRSAWPPWRRRLSVNKRREARGEGGREGGRAAARGGV